MGILDIFKKKEKTEPKYIYRDSITGKFVKKEYADANPDTTQAHEVKPD